ncbi:MAG: TRAP transporter small permease [Planctomycetaceae bacterium]|nr:TRAP transporter small permease [Planctomycetaceae bacterium]
MKYWAKIDRCIETIQTCICLVLFTAILGLGSVQIFSRYVTSFSAPWTEELMRFCMIWLALVGSALTIRVDGHVAVDILLTFTKSGKRKAILFTVARLICVVFLLVFFPFSIQLIIRSSVSRAASLPIPYAYVYTAVPVGIVMMLLSYISAIPKFAKQYLEGEK